MRRSFQWVVLISLIACGASSVEAQQRGQWTPGQSGLNAGVLGDTGLSFLNITVDYAAHSLRDANGDSLPVSGSFNLWVIENGFAYVPNVKALGGHLKFVFFFPITNGSIVADLGHPPQLHVSGGGSGYSDTWVQPLTLGGHLKRLDTYVGYAFVAPTGRYTAGASDNTGSGYWGNHILNGNTLYLTENMRTTANLLTIWEIHGEKETPSTPSGQITHTTPGQAVTTEWGLGQTILLKKDSSRLLQLGVVGYDQWQVSDNGGNYLRDGRLVPASLDPHYSVHAIGAQANFILPAKHLALFLKYEDEYSAKSRVRGHTIAFGGSWTVGVPKTANP